MASSVMGQAGLPWLAFAGMGDGPDRLRLRDFRVRARVLGVRAESTS